MRDTKDIPIHEITGHPPGPDTVPMSTSPPSARIIITFQNGATSWGTEGNFPLAEAISTLEIIKATLVHQQLSQMTKARDQEQQRKIFLATGRIPGL